MNIISNTCLGAYIYRDCLKTKYQNPFCWCFIDFDSMYYLIKNFNQINFLNYELIKDKNWNFSLIIENNIKIDWLHYHFSKEYTKIKIKNFDVYYCKIWEYIIKKYIIRLKRMQKNKEEPIFIIGSSYNIHLYTNEQLEKICSLPIENKIIICNNNYIINKKNIFCLTTSIKNNNYKLAKQVFKLL